MKTMLIDILDSQVDSKYFMSRSFVNRIVKRNNSKSSFKTNIDNDVASTICAGHYVKNSTDANYISINEATKKGFKNAFPGDGILLNFEKSKTKRGRVQRSVSGSILTNGLNGVCDEQLKIRKFTPNECRVLLGLPETFNRVCSDSQSYKQFGNSIVVNVLAAIFKNIFNTFV